MIIPQKIIFPLFIVKIDLIFLIVFPLFFSASFPIMTSIIKKGMPVIARSIIYCIVGEGVGMCGYKTLKPENMIKQYVIKIKV
jgi:hypothetical protein